VSLSADVAVGAAERLERTAGAGPALKVWRGLASNATGGELRGRAILGGLRCAMKIRDEAALRDLSLLWRTVEGVDEALWDGVFVAVKALAGAGLGGWATDLARSEVHRAKTARGLYALARCLDVASDPYAIPAFADALAVAEREGAARLVNACRVRRATWFSRSADTLGLAIDEAKRVDVGSASPAERFVVARVLLRAPSRFARASAIGVLDDLVMSGGPGAAGDVRERAAVLARRALLLAARHADDMNDELTPLEADRLVALFSREPVAKEMVRVCNAVRAIERLARAKEVKSEAAFGAALDEAARVDPELAILHQRARDILRGRFEAYESSRTAAHPIWTALLDAVVAMRDEAWPRTSHALGRLAESAERAAAGVKTERLPPHAWTVAQAALEAGDVEVRGAAGRLVAAMMKTTTASPPRGWLGLANALAACGMDDLATTARRGAALANEPGASDALALALTRKGWQLAQAGESERAIERLREARALAAPPPR
jgi:tetratricopeptide (TPR) repeat protein